MLHALQNTWYLHTCTLYFVSCSSVTGSRPGSVSSPSVQVSRLQSQQNLQVSGRTPPASVAAPAKYCPVKPTLPRNTSGPCRHKNQGCLQTGYSLKRYSGQFSETTAQFSRDVNCKIWTEIKNWQKKKPFHFDAETLHNVFNHMIYS